MKKIRNSKRGFTLTEILIVVAIVVVLSSAAFVGVAITLQNARDTNQKLHDEHGDNFELEARQAVRDITANAAEFFDIPYYTPDNNSDTNDDDDENTDENDEPGGGGGGGGGSQEGDTNSNSPTPAATSTPTSTPTPTPEPTATPTPAPSSGGIVPASGKTSDGKFVLTSSGGNKIHMVSSTNSGDTVDFTVSKNADGTYAFAVTGGNKWLFANTYKIFENNKIYFWEYQNTFSINLPSSFGSFFKSTLGLNID